MSKVLILGDVHIGKSQNLGKSNIYSSLNSRIIDQKKLLDWVLNKAYEENVFDIIITGDIFEDPSPKYDLINLFIDWLKTAEVYKINVHIILGNHDYTRINNIYYSPLDIIETANIKNTFVYKTPHTLHFKSTSISLFPFCDRKSLFVDSLELAKKEVKSMIDFQYSIIPIKNKSIAIGHFALEGSLYIGDEIDDITNEIILPLNYFEYDYVWMGHVHKYQELAKNKFHIGSMDISDFGEQDENKYIIIYDCVNNTYKKEKIPTIKLNKIQIEVSSEDYSELSNLKNINNSIVSLEIKYKNGIKPIGKSKLKEILNKENPYFITNISETKEIKLKENKKTKEFKSGLKLEDALKKYAEEFVPKDLNDKFLKYSKDLINKLGDK